MISIIKAIFSTQEQIIKLMNYSLLPTVFGKKFWVTNHSFRHQWAILALWIGITRYLSNPPVHCELTTFHGTNNGVTWNGGLGPILPQRSVGDMMTSSNGNIFRVTGPLWEEYIGYRWIPLTKASDAELWCFLWSAPEQTIEQTIESHVIWKEIALIVTSL